MGKGGFKFSLGLDPLEDPIEVKGDIGEKIYIESFIKTGFFKDQNELDVAKQAVKWWLSYLNKIKRRIEEDN